MGKKLTSLLLFFICGTAFSQTKFDSLKFSINIHPQFLLISGIKADIEYKLLKNFHVFGGGQFYTGLTNRNGDKTIKADNGTTSDQTKRANDEIAGNGFHLGGKYYFVHTTKEHFYVGAEYSYVKYNFKINDYGYFPYQDDGLTFYEYRLGKYDIDGSQSTSSLYFGATGNEGRFIVNAWFGVSLVNAKTDNKLKEFRNFDKLYWDFAYNGLSPLIGFKIGFLIL